MNLKFKKVSANFINSSDWYTVKIMSGAITLVFGDPDKKSQSYNGVAFGSPDAAIEVATKILQFANFAKKEAAMKPEAEKCPKK